MFDSGISVKELIKELNAEVDIALDIPNATYVQWLNSLQQLLYTEVIKEQKKITVSKWENNLVDISSVDIGNKENRPIFEDVYTVYTDDGTQLIKTTVHSGIIFKNTFFRVTDNLGFNTREIPKHLTIIYFVRPALVKVDDNDEIIDATVMLPVEFIDLAKAKLRGEAYKLANEDSLAAKWLNDYNILLETFKSWIADKSPNFGM